MIHEDFIGMHALERTNADQVVAIQRNGNGSKRAASEAGQQPKSRLARFIHLSWSSRLAQDAVKSLTERSD